MNRHRTVKLALAALAGVVVFVFITRGPGPTSPPPPGAFAFAAIGDAPYFVWEELQYGLVLDEIEESDLAWVLHVGDIFWRPCTDEHYRERLAELDGLPLPVVYTPGDNEWTDCWERGSGAFEPLERLRRLRELFFADPSRSLGGRKLSLTRQSADERFAEFVENARWIHEGVVFATVHLVGSGNGTESDPQRPDAAVLEEVERRTAAAVAWLRESFEVARTRNATALVLAFHADPQFELAAGDPDRRPFEPFLDALAVEAERFARPVLVIHGDNHVYTVDRPLRRGSTGEPLLNVLRVEVPGSPDVGWVRIVVTPDAAEPFSAELHVVPRWKYW